MFEIDLVIDWRMSWVIEVPCVTACDCTVSQRLRLIGQWKMVLVVKVALAGLLGKSRVQKRGFSSVYPSGRKPPTVHLQQIFFFLELCVIIEGQNVFDIHTRHRERRMIVQKGHPL